MEVTACVILGCLMGVIIGQLLGQFLTQQQFKKVLKNKQCRACKNIEECLGNWKKADENGNCKCFLEKQNDYEPGANLELILEHIESIEEDISRIEKAVFDDGKD